MRWARALSGCALLALGATLVAPAAQLAWSLAGHSAVVPDTVYSEAPAARPPDEIETDSILALAPFGQAAAIGSPARAVDAGRRLDLELRGVLVASDPAESRALISLSGSFDRYRIGDTLEDGATLTAIASDMIEVTVGGDIRRFGFDGAQGAAPASPSAAAGDETQAADSPLDRLRAALVPGRGSLDLREAPPAETTGDYIELWRQRIVRNPDEVLETIGLLPGTDGYTISSNPNIGVTLAGLKPGDVVSRVNGREVGDPERDRAFYDEIAASGQARLEVVRDGEMLLMSFPLR